MSVPTPSAPLHVIVGAGAVGTALARELVAGGARVRILTRSGSGPDHPAVERIALDVASASTPGATADRLAELTHGAAAIHNCANPAYHRWPTDWPPIANAMLAAAESSGAVLVTCSNLYAYHPDDTLAASTSGTGMTEGLPLTNPGRKGSVRARMWTDALAAHAAGRLRATEVRASDYLGATSASALGDQVVPRLLAGKPGRVLGDPDVAHAVTYVGDVARLMAVVATDPRAWGRPWHVPTHPARTVRRIVTDLAVRLGGDEFLLLISRRLPDAERRGHELLDRVMAYPWHEVAPGLSVGLSIGVISGPATEVDDLIAAADQGLYSAKSEGRGRVVLLDR